MKIIHKILPEDFVYSKQDELLYSEMPENIKAVLSYKSSVKRMMSMQGWESLRENLPSPELLAQVQFKDKGKPFIPNSDIHFNISNTKGAVITIIHDAPIGIDLERIREPRENIYERVFCKEEIDFIHSAEDFTNLWTRKEAVVKLFGGGISMGLKEFSVLKDELTAFGKQVKITKVELEGFVCHYATFKINRA